MSKLKSYKFSELYDMSSGISSKPEQAGHGFPFVSFSTVFNCQFLPEHLPDLMDTSEKERAVYSVKEGDIFLTRTSETLDELGMSSVAVKNIPNATYSGFLKRLRPRQIGVSYHKYMAFYLRSELFRRVMNNNAIMTLRASLNEQIFSYLDLLLPAYPEQIKIGDFLYLLHQRIELNNKINTELEAMAKLIYDYWFVQFDFPDANGNPYKSSGGKMVFDEALKREIPDGWKVEQFGKHNIIKRGELITKNSIETGKVKVVASGSSFSYLHSTPNCEKNTITISSSGNAGFVNFWREPIFASDCITVRGSTDVDTLLAFHYLKLIQNYLFKQARGSVQPHVYPSDISQLKLVIPPKKIVDKFGKIALRANDKIASNLKENELLIELRDWLLPMLMNGQVTVKDAYNECKKRMLKNGSTIL